MPVPSFSDQARSEYQNAGNDLATASPQEVLLRFYRRHDAALADAIGQAATQPACRAGCSYCCYCKVEARAIEIVAIRQYVLTNFKPAQIKAAVDQATLNVAQASGLSHVEQQSINQRCPFLLEDKCSIYPVRPTNCRSYHASNMEGCKQSFDDPAKLDIPTSFVPEMFNTSYGMTDGFHHATAKAGLDPQVYDLNSAFLEAMKNADVLKRLKNGKRVFLSARTVTPGE